MSDRIKSGHISKSAGQKIPNCPAILIVLMGSLGDIIRALCLVSHIKSHWPQSHVSWLVEARWAELIRLHSQIDTVIIFRREWRASVLWQLYKELSLRHFDIAFDLQRIFKSGFFSWLSGAKRRIGLHRNNTKEFNWIFNNEYIPYFSENLSKLSHYLKFNEQLGLPEPTHLDFGFDKLNVNKMAPPAVVEIQDAFIAVVLGSSW